MKLLLCIISLFLMTGCTNFFFHPSKGHVITPATLGLAYEDVFFDNDEITLHGWFLKAKGNSKGTVLFLHGNAENISTHIASVYWLPNRGFSVFMLDYRGYGLSKGKPTVDGVHSDVSAALSLLLTRKDVDKSSIVVFGQSTGGSIAAYTIANSQEKQHIKAVVIESAFSSYRTIASEKLKASIITYLLEPFLKYTISDKYSPIKNIHNISPTPILIVHGANDKIVPAHHSQVLYNAANEPKTLLLIPNGEHIAAFRDKQYRDKLVDFLEKSIANDPSQRDRYITKPLE